MHNTDFAVDLANRKVWHTSGAGATFHQYPNEYLWRISDVVMLHNPDLFKGAPEELARLAKRAALEAGMRHRYPA